MDDQQTDRTNETSLRRGYGGPPKRFARRPKVCPHEPVPERRQFLVRCIQTLQGAMGATLAFVVGRAVVAPASARRESMWLHAGSFDALNEQTPTAVTLRIARPDGASEVVDRRVVYLVRAAASLRAFDSTCTHLGCRTRYNAETNRIECPCHGGVYDTNGEVVEGPPPHPLATLKTRLDGDRILVEV